MKKFLIFLILFFTPSIVAGFLLFKFFPQDSKQLLDLGKTKLVEKAPFTKNYIALPAKKIEKTDKKQIPLEKKEIKLVNNLQHFTNAEVFSPICAEEIQEKFNEAFTQCNKCPKYMNYNNNDHNFMYFYETRGKILNKNDEEAFVIMKGCNEDKNMATIILLRNGYGGWQRVKHYSNIQIDKEPLEFFDSHGMLIFVTKKTLLSEKELKQEIYSFKIQSDKIEQKDLFAIGMERTKECHHTLQGSIEDPIKINGKTFQTNLELIGCKKNMLNGLHTVTFLLSEDNIFSPNKETNALMTKIEKYGENDAP